MNDEPISYSSTQHTVCAGCGVDKHTPLRRDEMGGYVCLTCIDRRLDQVPDEDRPGTLKFIPPNLDFLAIARLYLENYSILADEDRKLYRGMLLQMANPPMVVDTNKIRAEDVTFRTGAYVSDPKNDFPVVGFTQDSEKTPEGLDSISRRHPNTGRSSTGS